MGHGNFLKLYSFRRIKNLLFLKLSKMPMPGHVFRPRIVALGGVEICDAKTVFVGSNVSFDTVAPQRIKIGRGSVITSGVVILTHYINPSTGVWYQGDVVIGERVFLGINTIITKNVTIGNDSIIGAGSIVTKDIPANEIWAGNPARFIKKRK